MWADLQLLKKSRCEDKKSLCVSVLYPSCMYEAVEHGAFSRFHLHQTSTFEFSHYNVFSLFLSLFLSLIFLLSFSLSFSNSVSQTVVWTPQEKDIDRKRVREKDLRRKSGVPCARGVKADKLSCFSDILGVSERPSRTSRWDGRRYRSHGSWMRGTGRLVVVMHIILIVHAPFLLF